MKTRKLNTSKHPEIWTALAVAVGLLLLAALFWWDHIESGKRDFKERIRTKGGFQVERIEAVLASDIFALKNLTARIEHTEGEYFQYWSWDAKRLIRQNPSIQFVEWIDSNMVIQMVEPAKGNEEAIGLDISRLEYRSVEWRRNVSADRLNISSFVDLKQGGKAFLADHPVHFGGEFRGTLTIGLNYQALLDDQFNAEVGWVIAVRDEKGRLVYNNQRGEDSWDDPEMTYTQSIALPEQEKSWIYSIEPTRTHYLNEVVYKDIIGYLISVLLCLITGILVNISRLRARQKKKTLRVNHQLQELNRQLEEERERAEIASRSKTEFMSNMSHEIRTPLNALIGFVNVLKQRKQGQEDRKYLEMMEFSSNTLLSLVDDILEVDKIESGELNLRQEKFSARKKLQDLIRLFKPGFDEKGLELELIARGDDHLVLGDASKFNQVFTNLIRNAFKFTYSGGVRVHLLQEKVAERLNIRVKVLDTGIGIPEEKQAHIFDRFTQVDSSIRREYEGSGLGLSICKKLVEAMNGSISVNSQVGRGAAFTVKISLPVAVAQADTTSTNDQPVSFQESRILVVEDNRVNVMVLTKLLEQLDIQPDVARDGREAVEACEETDYDLVFMDLHMPVMDGIEATRQLRSMGLQVPIIALSANVTQEAMLEARDAGMQRYITKPFNRHQLIEVLNQYLAGTESHQGS